MIDLRLFDPYRQPQIEDLIAQGLPFDPAKLCALMLRARTGASLKVIASSGDGWDHVSVSVDGEARCPTWDEMDQVYKMVAKPGETWMQLHVPDEDHVNCHPWTLHIWRPLSKLKTIPRPPSIMVGPAPTGRG